MSRIPLTFLSVLAATGAALGACAPTPAAPDGSTAAVDGARPCFFTRQVTSFSEGERRSDRIYLRAGVNDTFELEMLGVCNEIDWARSVGIDQTFGGATTCVGDTVRLIVPTTGREPDRCMARVTRKLTDEERQALLNR